MYKRILCDLEHSPEIIELNSVSAESGVKGSVRYNRRHSDSKGNSVTQRVVKFNRFSYFQKCVASSYNKARLFCFVLNNVASLRLLNFARLLGLVLDPVRRIGKE